MSNTILTGLHGEAIEITATDNTVTVTFTGSAPDTADTIAALLRTHYTQAQPTPQLVTYRHNCGSSAAYHQRKYKHWCKRVTSINAAKSGGFAFEGPFLLATADNLVPAGSIVVEFCEKDLAIVSAYRIVVDAQKELIAKAPKNAMIPLIRAVKDALG